ncbi:TP901 family phage tail tape measure protein [Mycobacteroides abscessus subsp. abscessus]|uniref:tape measure protein n=1 Tax=Mycobacteroides abscessus TaxID=36809 RepID=UPI0009269575|nr:tape measure protein [Mycobacteroides abscessus]SIH29264.1 TP901 family phage tail tape measure protein [Mycobacteroides abscessus subsp. abscessus]SLB69499.1 TP901 family phage tail tape measure protein [Mycobacteroides abscessus subsp. abscessus]
MPEIETLWIPLAVTGKNLKRDMEREVTGAGTNAGNKIAKEMEDAAGRGAKRAAAQIDSTLGARLGEKTGAALGKALGIGLRPVVGTVQTLGGEAGRQWVQRFAQQLASAKVNAPKVNAPISVDIPGNNGRSGGSGGGGLAAAGMLGAITRVAGPAAIALGVTGLAYKTLSAGFDRAKSLDATRFKLQALGNDATAVAQIMAAAQGSVKGTAFSMDEAATTAATAVAAGVKPGEDLSKYLTTVADAAAIAGADLGDMGHIFNKVQTSGKAMTDDLNMLGDRGLPIFAWLQKEYKVTGAELSKMVEKGQVDAATFQRVIAQNVGGAAKKMGGTFEGSVKNMGAALGRLGESIISPFLGSGTDALGQITVGIDKVAGFIKEHQPEIIRFAAAVGTGFMSMAGAVSRGFGTAIRGVAKFLDGIKTASGGIGKFLSVIPGLEGVGDAMQRWGADRSVNDWLREAANSADAFGNKATAASDRIAKWGEDTAETTRIVNALGTAVAEVPDTHEIVLTDNSPEQIARLNAIGYTVQAMPDGKNLVVKVDDSEATARLDALRRQLEDLAGQRRNANAAAEIFKNSAGAQSSNPVNTAPPSGVPFLEGLLPRMFGAIAMASGGLRFIDKPASADIYAGRGAGTIFAEQETGGEAYIPLAPGKRSRSLAILREVMRIFGINSFAGGGISVDELKSMASGIEGQSYGWGAPAGPNSDCSGAQSWIANMISGGTGRFATAGQAGALAARGFQMGDPPPGIAAYWVGWKNGGPGGGHTAGTIVDPEGGNVNVEMGGKRGNGQFGGGAAGASDFPSRAWIALAAGDNGKTTGGGGASPSQVMSAQSSVRRTKAASAAAQKDLDDANAELNSAPDDKKRAAAEKKRDSAQRRLDTAKDRQAIAEQKLSEVLDKKAQGTDKEAGAGDAGSGMGQGLGQGIISGLFQGLGIDGSVFSNPMEWPNVKSGMAALNWGLNFAQKMAGQPASGAVGGEIPGAGAELNFASGLADGALSGLGVTVPKDSAPAPAGPPAGGDTYNLSGVAPREIMPKLEARSFAANQRNLGTRRPS